MTSGVDPVGIPRHPRESPVSRGQGSPRSQGLRTGASMAARRESRRPVRGCSRVAPAPDVSPDRTEALYGRTYLGSSAPPTWKQRSPHLEVPEFLVGTRDRCIGVVERLAEGTPSAERLVRAAPALVDSGAAFP